MANHERDPAKEQFWRGALARWQSSGLSIRNFCFRESLSEGSFYQWRRELARRDQAVRQIRTKPRFVPVRVVAENASPRNDHALEIVLPDGHLVRVGANFDAQTLAAVLQVLECRRC